MSWEPVATPRRKVSTLPMFASAHKLSNARRGNIKTIVMHRDRSCSKLARSRVQEVPAFEYPGSDWRLCDSCGENRYEQSFPTEVNDC